MKEVNQFGNEYVRSFMMCDTLYYQLRRCLAEDGWSRYHTGQDDTYFGIWVNPTKLEIMTFCEGDETHTICKDEYSYSEELDFMYWFYEAMNN